MPDRERRWDVQHHRGTADELHHLDLASSVRTVHVMDLAAPAVALGSTQSEAVLDGAAVRAAGRSVTRRHSGGGLVVLNPGEVVWIDVVVPVGDPLWQVDVGAAFTWLGRVWAQVVEAAIGDVGVQVHDGGPAHADLGRAVCFAGVGSGEVVVGGRKVVGMSQRRTREWARFQCLAHRRFDADESLAVLAPHLVAGAFGRRLGDRLATGVGVLGETADSVGDGGFDGLVTTFLERLQLA